MRSAKLSATAGAIVIALVATSAATDDGRQRVRARDNAIELIDGYGPGLDGARGTGLPVFLMFSAAWCPVCQNLKRQTLLDVEIQQLASRFVWVDVDIDRNLSLARQWGVNATPTIFLLDARGTPRRTIVGGAAPAELAEILTAFLDSVDRAPEEETDEIAEFRNGPLTWKPSGYRSKSICFSHVGYGPLRLRSQSPFQSLRLSITPRTPSTLGRGQWEGRGGATWANIWANDDDRFFPEQGEYGAYLLDYETLHFSVGASHGLSDTVQVELEYDERRRFGGVMDSFIQSFHDALGIDQSGREQVAKDQFRIFLDPMDGRPVVDQDASAKGVFTRSLQFTVQHNVTCGSHRWPAFSYSVTGRWNVESDDLEGDEFDVAASVAVARRFGDRWYTYLTLGYAYFGDDTFHGLELRSDQMTVLAAVEWRFASRMSLILQYLGSQGAAEDLGPFSETANEVTLGWKAELRPAGVLEIGLIENVATFDNSPDFGIHVGFTQRF